MIGHLLGVLVWLAALRVLFAALDHRSPIRLLRDWYEDDLRGWRPAAGTVLAFVALSMLVDYGGWKATAVLVAVAGAFALAFVLAVRWLALNVERWDDRRSR